MSKLDRINELADRALDLMEKERQAILNGDFAELQRLTELKATAFEKLDDLMRSLGPAGLAGVSAEERTQIEEKFARLAATSERVVGLIRTAMSSIAEAREMVMETMKAAEKPFLYGSSGKRVPATGQKPRDIARI